MATLNRSIGSDFDMGQVWSPDEYVSLDDFGDVWIGDDPDDSIWVRFPNITIPAGSTITEAYITFDAPYVEESGTIESIISGIAEDDHVAPEDYDEWEVDHNNHTTASVTWDFATGTGTHQTTDITDIVQELVDRPGWASGNAMGFHADDDNTNGAIQAMDDATITIVYTEPYPNHLSTTTTADTSGGTVAIDLPATDSGDLLLIGAMVYQGVSDIDGFTEIGSAIATGTDDYELSLWAKDATGSEGATVDATTAGDSISVYHVIRVEAGTWSGDINDLVRSTGATGSSANPDPDEVTGTEADNLFVAITGHEEDGGFSAYPANYADGASNDDGINTSMGSASRKLTADSDDPGTFTAAGGADPWGAYAVIVPPAGAAPADAAGQISHAELETADAPRAGELSHAELETTDAPRAAQTAWAELEAPTAPRRAEVSFTEAETPDAPREGQLSHAELETGDGPRTGQISHAEVEAPTAPRQGQASFAELEVPTAPRAAQASFAELEAQDAPRSGQTAWAELEVPTAPRTGQISHAELEADDAPREAQLSFAELELGAAPRRAGVSHAELETDDAPRTAGISHAELEAPLAPRAAQISHAEAETPNEPVRAAQLSHAEVETGDGPRQAAVAWAELQTPDEPRQSQISHAELEIPTAPREGQISHAELETDEAPRSGQLGWAELQTDLAPRSGQLSIASLEAQDAPRAAEISVAELEGPTAPRQGQISQTELETPTAPRSAELSWAHFELDEEAPRSAEISQASFATPDPDDYREGQISHATLEAPFAPFGPAPGQTYKLTGSRTRGKRARADLKHRKRYNRHRNPA